MLTVWGRPRAVSIFAHERLHNHRFEMNRQKNQIFLVKFASEKMLKAVLHQTPHRAPLALIVWGFQYHLLKKRAQSALKKALLY